MKIDDKELLNLIFKAQIKVAATGVIHNYIGGNKGVCCDTDYWQGAATDISFSGRSAVTDKIGKNQLLKRIRKLIEQEDIIHVTRNCTFSINNPEKIKELFTDARKFWLSMGLPEGYDNGRANTANVENFEELKDQAIEFLTSKYA